MKITALVCTGVNRLEAQEFEKPAPARDAALLRIKYCGVCGTDTHGIEGKRKVDFPFIPGHEIVAAVDSMGEDANRSIRIVGADRFRPGDRVTINPRIVCGRCSYCLLYPGRQELCLNAKTATSLGCGQYPHLFGGWAEYLYVLPGSELIKLPDGLTDEAAALVEPYACGIGMADRYRELTGDHPGSAFLRGDAVAVFGAGAIGMLAIAALKLAGVRTVVAMDADEKRLRLAREFGADHTLDVLSTTAEERRDAVMRLTGGIGLDAVAECCGVPATIGEGIGLLRRRGMLFEMGHLLNAGMAEIDPYAVCRNEIQLLGHYAYPSSLTLLHAAKVLEQGAYPYDKLMRFVGYRQYDSAINRKNGSGAIKTVLSFS